jgi:2-dehydropantoate 2-reductase
MGIQRVLIAGAGAIGLTVADTLYRHNPAGLAILAGGERLERYRTEGLWINGRRMDFNFVEPGAEGKNTGPSPFDLIIVASKSYHLPQIITGIKPYVGEDTIILSLLNGISSEEILDRAFPYRGKADFGGSRLPLAMIVCIDAQRDGSKASFGQRGTINFGDARGRETERDRTIAEFFSAAGLPFEYHPHDMKQTLWYKFMVNVGVNQTSALLRLPYGAYKKKGPKSVIEAQKLLEMAMGEVVAIANAEGIPLGEGDIAKWFAAIEVLNDESYTSMCQDVLARRKTELELFSPTVMEYGKKHGIPTPVNEFLYLALRTIERGFGRA